MFQPLLKKALKEQGYIVEALGTMKDKLKGFEIGADDYLLKPFHFEELLARIRSLIRRRMIAPSFAITGF
jgi:DNA-binding response OmpR family regulator